MAKRPAFFVNQGKIINEMYSFEWYCGIVVLWYFGFAVSLKQKSIKSLHNAIIKAA